jgi:hypothetical protein
MRKRKIPNLLCRVVRNWKCDHGRRGPNRLYKAPQRHPWNRFLHGSFSFAFGRQKYRTHMLAPVRPRSAGLARRSAPIELRQQEARRLCLENGEGHESQSSSI